MEVELSTLIQALRPAISGEVAFAVANRERFIYYQPGTQIDLSIQPGEKLRRGSASLHAIQERRIYASLVDKQVFGQAYFATSYPVPLQTGELAAITIIFPPAQQRRLQDSRPSFLVGKAEDRWVPLPYSQIFFIQSENGKTYLHTTKGVFQNKFTLSELEQFLPVKHFFRVHRAYIIRMAAVAEIQPHFHSTFMLIMQDEGRSKIPVSQKYASSFRKLLGF